MNDQAQTSGTGNGTAAKLSALKDLNWPTLILVLFTGGTNFLATQKGTTEREYQIDQSIRQVRELHEALDETEKRQRAALNNQTTLLENDSSLLKEVHTIVVKLDDWKRNEQMRGAPQ
jgi:hypothetical protein